MIKYKMTATSIESKDAKAKTDAKATTDTKAKTDAKATTTSPSSNEGGDQEVTAQIILHYPGNGPPSRPVAISGLAFIFSPI